MVYARRAVTAVPDPTLVAPIPSPAAETSCWEQRLSLELDYPVVFTHGALRVENPALHRAIGRVELERRHRVFAVIDDGVAAGWPALADELAAYARGHHARLELVAEPMRVPGGEAIKNDPAVVHRLHEAFFRARLDRHCVVLVVGGGAVLDAVGYAAAVTHRGLRVVRMPSTVLAQNDAGIGVKNGINAFGTKNFLGTFAPPFAVINDAELLRTLPARDRRAGAAEAVKVALIRDPIFLAWLERHAAALAAGEPEATATMIRRCAELHLHHIRSGGDPFETGSARPLDFGHWSAHKLEVLSEHELRHGEAVAIGMALDCLYARATGRLSTAALERVLRLLHDLRLPQWHPALERRGAEGRLVVLDGLEEFREHLGGTLTLTMLEDIGVGVEVHEIDRERMTTCIEALAERQGKRAAASDSAARAGSSKSRSSA